MSAIPSHRRVFGNELKYVQEVLATEFRSSQGSMFMRRLEQAFAEKYGTPYAISFVNGTVASGIPLVVQIVAVCEPVSCASL